MLRKLLAFMLIFITLRGYAAIESDVVHVGVNNFSPPFIMRTGSNGYYGFDISMMLYICKNINRTCKFHSMRFEDLLDAVEAGRIDVAVSAITITYERSQHVNFSNPYLPSTSRFLGLINYKDKRVTKKFITGKKIGIKQGSIFAKQLKRLNLQGVRLYEYTYDSQLIDALSSKKVDLVLTDNATAVYWQYHSSEKMIAIGKPIKYGFGYGIASNLRDKDLHQEINMALAKYHKSMHFENDFETYLGAF